MTTDPSFDLDTALAELSLERADLARLCGVGRQTAWKWQRKRLPVPIYVKSLLRQQQTIRRLAAALVEREDK